LMAASISNVMSSFMYHSSCFQFKEMTQNSEHYPAKCAQRSPQGRGAGTRRVIEPPTTGCSVPQQQTATARNENQRMGKEEEVVPGAQSNSAHKPL